MIKRRTRAMTADEIEIVLSLPGPGAIPLSAMAAEREDAINKLARTPLPARKQIGHNDRDKQRVK